MYSNGSAWHWVLNYNYQTVPIGPVNGEYSSPLICCWGMMNLKKNNRMKWTTWTRMTWSTSCLCLQYVPSICKEFMMLWCTQNHHQRTQTVDFQKPNVQRSNLQTNNLILRLTRRRRRWNFSQLQINHFKWLKVKGSGYTQLHQTLSK